MIPPHDIREGLALDWNWPAMNHGLFGSVLYSICFTAPAGGEARIMRHPELLPQKSLGNAFRSRS
jgi:hypothetical protein